MNELGWSKRGRACRVLLLCVTTAIGLPAQILTTLVSFDGPDGINGGGPWGLVQGTDGNFYGTTFQGGLYGNDGGTVFKFTPAGTLTTLYSFCSLAGCPDSSQPYAGLIQGSDGNFYGTTVGRGAEATDQGSVFKITPAGTLTTLYSFCSQAGCADGAQPYAGLIQGSDGNFYGTTGLGGLGGPVSTFGGGTVFEITPGGALTTLYSFCSQAICADGAQPYAGLLQASDGNFYGTTRGGGANQWGTVFKLTPGGALTTLYSFCSQAGCADGAQPMAGLIQASDGNLYGTTAGGYGLYGGTVFKITPGGALTTLYGFPGGAGGPFPMAGLIQASDGNFYGTATGEISVHGTVFKITPDGALTTLYTFSRGVDGAYPKAGLIQGADGSFYGTTTVGEGLYGLGTIFNLILAPPTPAPAIDPSGGVVSSASFQVEIAPDSWITIAGTNLSSVTDNWGWSIGNGVLPTSLDGVSVSVGGKPAYISYISPTLINAVAPDVGTGTLPVAVTNSGATSSAVSASVQPVAPAFFQWGTYAVATRLDYSPAVRNGTLSTTTTPAAPGDVIVLWGTGFGPTNPSAPDGVEVPSDTIYNTASPVTVTVGGVPAIVYDAALTPESAGLYQVTVQIPASLANGDYPVIATVSGAQSPSTTLITVQD